MENRLFLEASRNSAEQLTQLFDFVWPTSAAIWNLQWQTKGYLTQVPDATDDDLRARFVLGSGIRGANIRRVAETDSTDQIQKWFARLLLAETCALFEGWIESAIKELAIPTSISGSGGNKLDKRLQFPTIYDQSGNITGGVHYGIQQIRNQGISNLISSCFKPTMLTSRKNSIPKIVEFLICYRAFKEVRNNFVHHGGVADQKSESAWVKYDALPLSALGLKEKPILSQVVAGQPVDLSVRGVVGFSDVVLRLMYTLDTELSDSTYGEHLFKNRWQRIHADTKILNATKEVRDKQLVQLVRQCNFPKPQNLNVLYAELHNEGLVI